MIFRKIWYNYFVLTKTGKRFAFCQMVHLRASGYEGGLSMENLRKGTYVHMRFDVIVAIAGIAVTLVSIFTTCISIWQTHKNIENQKSNRPRTRE